ncbi:MAG: hypothetical protein KKB20_22430 [Proteobacteria bacterium]|nr:hypothetical protein [Pseudomonadota bacterium]
MEIYKKEFAHILADSGALFFTQGLRLKDGRPTPYFINLGLFRTGRLSTLIGGYLARMIAARDLLGSIDVLVGPSYKGSALAVATAQALWSEHSVDVMFEYDRKEPKTHGEATGRESAFVTNALHDGARIYVVDDVGTSMATKYALLKLLKAESSARRLHLHIVGVGLAVDREQTSAVLDENGHLREGVRGEDAIGRFIEETGHPVHALIGVREMVRYLADEGVPIMIGGVKRPLDPATMKEFEDYMAVYGVTGR